MSKYKVNLMKDINPSNWMKWGIITMAVFFVIIMIIISVISQNRKNNKYEEEPIFTHTQTVTDDTLNYSENKDISNDNNGVEELSTEILDEKFSKKYNLPEKFVNSIAGYKITMIKINKGIEPIAGFRNNKTYKEAKIGENLIDYEILEIHRTYVLLKRNGDLFHLNFVDL